MGRVTQIVRRLNPEAKYDLKLDLKILDPAAAEKTVLFRQVDAGLFPGSPPPTCTTRARRSCSSLRSCTIAHALHGKARKLTDVSPVTGEVVIFDHDPL